VSEVGALDYGALNSGKGEFYQISQVVVVLVLRLELSDWVSSICDFNPLFFNPANSHLHLFRFFVVGKTK